MKVKVHYFVLIRRMAFHAASADYAAGTKVRVKLALTIHRINPPPTGKKGSSQGCLFLCPYNTIQSPYFESERLLYIFGIGHWSGLNHSLESKYGTNGT